MEYSIVIPTYNEANKITSTLTKIIGFMRTFSESFEIIVSDDGSEDTTVELVDNYSKSNKEIRLIQNPHRGKGPTVITGIDKSKGRYVYMCDADLSTPIAELKKLSIWITEHEYDIVIGSREGTGAVRVDEPLYRHLMGRIFNYFVQIMVLRGIKDSQCGFKLFKSAVVKDILSRMVVYAPNSRVLQKSYWGAFDVELLYIARKSGYKIKELPVLWNYIGHANRSLAFNTVRMSLDVLKIRLNSLKGVYK